MNTKFKPLGLVAAVAAATAGYAGIATAQQDPVLAGNSDLGNLALIPYYTVRDGNVTGVHITNTSDLTQVVKVRLRRGTDSMDALDFNLILSPFDVWTGFVAAEGDDVVFNTTDSSCTAPATTGGKFTMPGIYRANADEGYIEIIGMGAADEDQAIYASSLHDSDGVPADCAAVRDNFFAGGVATTRRGTVDGLTSVQRAKSTGATLALNEYLPPSNALKVSYFIRDAEGGREFGNSATHIANFLVQPSITNQQFGLFSGDLLGFDFPDLNGGIPLGSTDRDRFLGLRSILGSSSVINDWSANAGLNVGTDWVITFPGQYTMLDLPHYFASLLTAGTDAAIPCNRGLAIPAGFTAVGSQDADDFSVEGGCDHRDIPAEATFQVYDREEQTLSGPEGELVVSPQLPGAAPRTLLPFEVNVVQWGVEPVLGSANSPVTVQTPGDFGWAELTVTSANAGQLAVCEASPGNALFNLADGINSIVGAVVSYGCSTSGVVADEIPKIGFVAWERSFPGNPDANYGRIVEHSYGIES
jgi:hypothetical protein